MGHQMDTTHARPWVNKQTPARRQTIFIDRWVFVLVAHERYLSQYAVTWTHGRDTNFDQIRLSQVLQVLHFQLVPHFHQLCVLLAVADP